MRKSARYTFLVPLILAGLLTACGDEAPPAAEPPAPTVTVTAVEPEPVTLTRELPGRTNAFLIAEVRPQVTGVVEERLFTEGGLVEAGEALYQLDDATYQADYNRAEATLARAEATVKLARVSAERASGLFESNAVSKQEYDNAMAALQQAEADVGVARAALVSAEVMLNYSRITSPIAGRIGKSSVTQGALVTANQPQSLATVQQLDPIYVDLSQSASELLRLRRAIAEGNLQEAELPVTVLLDDGTTYEHEGKVAFSEVTVDPTTGSFSLRVVVPNPDHILLPGMYVRAVIGAGIRENGLLVPQQSIVRGPGGSTTLMIVRENNTVEQRAVRIGQSVGNRSLVEEGLVAGDRVVLEGLQMIRPEMRVEVTEAASTNPEAAASNQ